MAYPKMTLQVQLISTNGAIIKLINVTGIYTRNISYMNTGKAIVTKNNWLFFVKNDFSINLKTKVAFIPINPHQHKVTFYFKDNNDRKKQLKDFHEALMEWSGHKVFANKNIFDKNPKIRYHKDIWIIF